MTGSGRWVVFDPERVAGPLLESIGYGAKVPVPEFDDGARRIQPNCFRSVGNTRSYVSFIGDARAWATPPICHLALAFIFVFRFSRASSRRHTSGCMFG